MFDFFQMKKGQWDVLEIGKLDLEKKIKINRPIENELSSPKEHLSLVVSIVCPIAKIYC